MPWIVSLLCHYLLLPKFWDDSHKIDPLQPDFVVPQKFKMFAMRYAGKKKKKNFLKTKGIMQMELLIPWTEVH